jgi:hypothetical protein
MSKPKDKKIDLIKYITDEDIDNRRNPLINYNSLNDVEYDMICFNILCEFVSDIKKQGGYFTDSTTNILDIKFIPLSNISSIKLEKVKQ